MESKKYFNNSTLLENTLLPYFCEPEPLKLINKIFLSLNYEKYNTHIQPHGIIETYYRKTKILAKRETYKNGKLNGLHEGWYENGKLQDISNCKNDLFHGLYETFYLSGKLWNRCWYKNGILDGLWEMWYENSQEWSRANYKNGKLVK